MKIETKALIRAVKLAALATERRNTIPILGCVLIDDGLVKGTDLDTTIAVEIPSIGAPASLTLSNPRGFPSLLEASRSSEVEIVRRDWTETVRGNKNSNSVAQRADRNVLRTEIALTAGRLAVKLGALPVADFPVQATPALDFVATITPEHVRLLERVAIAMSTEDTRYYLNGVFLHHIADWSFALVATDGHRLHKAVIQLPDAVGSMLMTGSMKDGAIIPRKAVQLLVQLSRQAKDQPIRIVIGRGGREKNGDPLAAGGLSCMTASLTIADQQVVMTTKLIDGTFPDYTRVVPAENTIHVSVDVKDLRSALKAFVANSSERTKAVTLTAGDGKMALGRRWIDDAVEARITLEAETVGALEIGFNARYLEAILDATLGDRVLFKMLNATSPSLVVDPATADFLTVIMPMRIG